MEGIQELRGRTPVSIQQTAVRSGEAKKAAPSADTDSFQSVLSEKERAEQAAKTPSLPSFSKMTDRQKLSALATLHDATDYSGMTDVEKYKLMNDRFEAAFPHLRAYEAGLFGRDSVSYYGTNRMAREVKGTGTRIQEEKERQWNSQGLSGISALHREAYYGGMTDAEAALAVSQRHSGGNLAAQADVLQELKMLGLGDGGKTQEALEDMRAKLVQWARKSASYEGTETENAAEEETVYALAAGGRVRSGGGTDWSALTRLLADSEEAWDKKLAAGYGQQVQKVIDGLLDGIVKAERGERAPNGGGEQAGGTVAEAE